MKNGDKTAFPTDYGRANVGVTKREYFAGLAMQGLLARNETNLCVHESVRISEEAVIMADALLVKLAKEGEL